jgi:hypothetical protein
MIRPLIATVAAFPMFLVLILVGVNPELQESRLLEVSGLVSALVFLLVLYWAILMDPESMRMYSEND